MSNTPLIFTQRSKLLQYLHPWVDLKEFKSILKFIFKEKDKLVNILDLISVHSAFVYNYKDKNHINLQKLTILYEQLLTQNVHSLIYKDIYRYRSRNVFTEDYETLDELCFALICSLMGENYNTWINIQDINVIEALMGFRDILNGTIPDTQQFVLICHIKYILVMCAIFLRRCCYDIRDKLCKSLMNRKLRIKYMPLIWEIICETATSNQV